MIHRVTVINQDENNLDNMVISLQLTEIDCVVENIPYDFWINYEDQLSDSDLILLDWQHPVQEKVDCLRKMLAIPRLSQIPVLLLSNAQEERSIEVGLRAGALDYIRKPLNKLNFKTRIQGALRMADVSRARDKSDQRLQMLANQVQQLRSEGAEKSKAIAALHETLNDLTSIGEMQKQEILQQKMAIELEKQKTESLLLNMLPNGVALQLKEKGSVKPRAYRQVTVMFTDFVGFTKSSTQLPPEQLVRTLDVFFSYFDSIVSRHYIEKIKTIGDAYMCAGGIPVRNRSNPFDVLLAALEILAYTRTYYLLDENKSLPIWSLRCGIHTGPIISGVVGKSKFAYDIWGDTVNTAARMEQLGEPDCINVSDETYQLVKDYFVCQSRGKIEAKGKGLIDMYFVERIKPEFSEDAAGVYPNQQLKHVIALM